MSGAPTRVFVARLAGIAAFDPRGDQVGKVRDVVVTLRHGANAPRVLGLVIEVQPRRRIFCPMTRVTSIDAGAVVTTGLLNIRRFEQRSGETLVMSELLDRRVTLLETDEVVTVQDVAIMQERTRDWAVSRIFVRKPGKGLRRRGETLTVNWNAVSGLSLHDPQQGVDSLLATVENLRAADLANVMHELTPKRRQELAIALDDEKLADVLEELPEDDRIEILASLGGERAADILEEMDPDDAADLLSELPPEQAEALLSLVEPEEAEDLRRLLRYDDYTAGGMMTPEPVILPPDSTVADALARIRDADLPPALAAQVYVVRPPFETPTGRYLGVAHFQRLLREPPSTLVSAVLDDTLEPIGPQAPLTQVTRYFATYNLVALPVVDEDDHLLGAVTVDDVIDHMLPENWRDEDSLDVLDGEDDDLDVDDTEDEREV
ncbi:MAG: CBS domain-containing protein [Actinomycetes bacterium]|jgi:Mg/Co/Ni transporter MgtE